MKVNKSPIFYMGNKERLIKKGLINYFPKNINKFVDVFCGSGIVSMNVEAEIYILNDINPIIIDLLSLFEDKEYSYIIEKMKNIIKEHGLMKGYNKRDLRETDEYKAKAKEKYNAFRKYYNEVDRDIINLYVLSYYCNNNNIRFNKKGEFNMPIGNQYFNKEKRSEKVLSGCEFFKNNATALYNDDYKNILEHFIYHNTAKNSNDFIYLDPPYSNTTAIYNEQLGWSIDNDLELFRLCEQLTAKGIRWAMSNVYENKGKVNQHLIDWVKKQGLRVEFFDGFNYVACGKGNGKTVEVLIMNY